MQGTEKCLQAITEENIFNWLWDNELCLQKGTSSHSRFLSGSGQVIWIFFLQSERYQKSKWNVSLDRASIIHFNNCDLTLFFPNCLLTLELNYTLPLCSTLTSWDGKGEVEKWAGKQRFIFSKDLTPGCLRHLGKKPKPSTGTDS